MQIEDIARIGLTSGRTAQDQGYFTIGDSLFREVVVDHQGMASAIPEIFADSGSGKRSEVLHGCRIGSCRTNNNRIVHRTLFLQRVDKRGDSRTFLSDRHIDAINRIARFVIAALVDDRVDRDGSFSCLAVTDDKFTLSASDRYHGVDSLDAGLQRFVHRLAEDHARSFALKRHLAGLACNFPFSVDRVSERVDYTSDHVFANVDRGDTSCPFDRVTLFHEVGRPQQDGSHVVFFEVHHDRFHSVVELQQFVRLGIVEAIYACHTIAHLKYGTHFFRMDAGTDTFQLLAQDGGNFTHFYLICHTSFFFICFRVTGYGCPAAVSHSWHLSGSFRYAGGNRRSVPAV